MNPPYLTGQLLLALPGIGDERFDRAVIAICVHDENGALGLCVGDESAGIGLHGLMRQLGVEPGEAPDLPVLRGGPVEPQRGFVLHSLDWGGEGTVQVEDRWALTSTLDVLRAIAEGHGPSRWLVALGYAGWNAGQLDEELAGHGWLAVPGNDETLYGVAPEQRWAAAFADAGIDARLLAATTGHA